MIPKLWTFYRCSWQVSVCQSSPVASTNSSAVVLFCVRPREISALCWQIAEVGTGTAAISKSSILCFGFLSVVSRSADIFGSNKPHDHGQTVVYSLSWFLGTTSVHFFSIWGFILSGRFCGIDDLKSSKTVGWKSPKELQVTLLQNYICHLALGETRWTKVKATCQNCSLLVDGNVFTGEGIEVLWLGRGQLLAQEDLDHHISSSTCAYETGAPFGSVCHQFPKGEQTPAGGYHGIRHVSQAVEEALWAKRGFSWSEYGEHIWTYLIYLALVMKQIWLLAWKMSDETHQKYGAQFHEVFETIHELQLKLAAGPQSVALFVSFVKSRGAFYTEKNSNKEPSRCRCRCCDRLDLNFNPSCEFEVNINLWSLSHYVCTIM